MPLAASPYMLWIKAIPRSAALLRYELWINSPLFARSLTTNFERSAIRAILTLVTPKQNSTNFPFHVPAKSCPARSSNTSTGNAALKTNLFIQAAAFSSISPILRNTYPSTINAKIGVVAFRLKTKFSMSISNLFQYPVKQLRIANGKLRRNVRLLALQNTPAKLFHL